MIARQIVDDGWARLEAAGIPEAKTKAEWLVAEWLEIRRDALDTTEITPPQQHKIESGFARLATHEPLQHVIGHAPFLDLKIFTDKRALVPRPETEELAMRVLACAPLWSRQPARIADVGTGTGCLAILFAVRHPAATIYAVDTSHEALELARLNADYAGVGDRIQFQSSNLLDGFAPGSLDAVVSNPPYISHAIIQTLDPSVRDFEPRAALDGGADGLGIIKKLIPQAFTALADGGRLWLEIGDEQGDPVFHLLQSTGFNDVSIDRDMFGQIRFAGAVK